MSNEAVTRFAADRMLLRLARWLRLAGIDVIDDRSLAGHELLIRARLENRILLTRDKRLRTAGDVHFVEHNDFRDQLHAVLDRFAIDPGARAFTRCSRCNLALVEVARENVSRRVPPYVFASIDRFAECLGCGRIYWAETHQRKITAMLGIDRPLNRLKPQRHRGTKLE